MVKKNFKGKIYLINYSSGKYVERMKKMKETYYKCDIDYFDIWNKDRLIKTDFYKEHLKIFNTKKGDGLWLWKPFIILELMNKIEDNDFIIYCDSSINEGFQYSVIPMINYLHDNNLIYPGTHLFTDAYKLKYWTHNKTFEIMNVDKNIYGEKSMCQTSPNIWRKNDLCQKFLNEWLYYCCQYDCIKYIDNMDKKNVEEKHLLRSQCDQSILSILIHKYNLKVFSPRGPFPSNIVTDEKKKDKKNGIHNYVRFLKDFNYYFQLACENKLNDFINI